MMRVERKEERDGKIIFRLKESNFNECSGQDYFIELKPSEEGENIYQLTKFDVRVQESLLYLAKGLKAILDEENMSIEFGRRGRLNSGKSFTNIVEAIISDLYATDVKDVLCRKTGE